MSVRSGREQWRAPWWWWAAALFQLRLHRPPGVDGAGVVALRCREALVRQARVLLRQLPEVVVRSQGSCRHLASAAHGATAGAVKQPGQLRPGGPSGQGLSSPGSRAQPPSRRSSSGQTGALRISSPAPQARSGRSGRELTPVQSGLRQDSWARRSNAQRQRAERDLQPEAGFPLEHICRP